MSGTGPSRQLDSAATSLQLGEHQKYPGTARSAAIDPTAVMVPVAVALALGG